jgi:hypothetical protein
MSKNNIHTLNGVSYHHAGRGKWHFTGINPKTGLQFTKIEKVHGRDNANKVANIVGGGLKRAKCGIDGMARSQVNHVVFEAGKHYDGINFSQAFPLNVTGRANIH